MISKQFFGLQHPTAKVRLQTSTVSRYTYCSPR